MSKTETSTKLHKDEDGNTTRVDNLPPQPLSVTLIRRAAGIEVGVTGSLEEVIDVFGDLCRELDNGTVGGYNSAGGGHAPTPRSPRQNAIAARMAGRKSRF